MTLRIVACAVCVAALPPATAVTAQVVHTSAQVLFLDPSIASSGRGRASTAAFWEDGPDHWANPALLAYHRGVRYEWGETELVPDLTDGVFYRTHRVSVGAYGLAVATAGRPYDGLGRQRLDYGESRVTDNSGHVIGSFRSREDVGMLAAAASAGELLAGFAPGVRVADLPVVRFADVAVGYADLTVESDLAPPIDGLGDGRGRFDTSMWGFFARATPLDPAHPWVSPRFARVLPLRLDLAFGISDLNGDHDALVFDVDPVAVARMQRRGWSTHLSLGLPAAARHALRTGGAGWLGEVIQPLLRWGYAWDRPRMSLRDPDTGEVESGPRFEEQGWEVTVLNLVTLRRGRVEDWGGQRFGHGKTEGWGFGLELGTLGGFRYDEATTPQSEGLADVHRKGVSVWLDPVAIWRRTGG